MFDGFSFDLFPPFENGLAAPEVDVSRRQLASFTIIRMTGNRIRDETTAALYQRYARIRF